MKKSIFIAVLGVAAVAATSSYGQGYVDFSSYLANGGVGATTSQFVGGALIGTPYVATLYYAFGTVADPVNETSANSITSPVGAGFTLLGGLSAAYANSGQSTPGYFDGGVAVIPGYVSGAISFEIVATGPNELGRSGAWTEFNPITGAGIANSSGVPVSFFGDNGVMPNFLVAPVPEPTTLALAGLGGLASLVALRRKQA
jgi:hypothetical protein